MTSRIVEDIDDFIAKFGLAEAYIEADGAVERNLVIRKRIAHLKEEIQEIEDAIDPANRARDTVALVDGLVDLVYIAIGTVQMMGLEFDDHWKAVHYANMSKVRVHDPDTHKFGIKKPEGWIGPEGEHKRLIVNGK